jgi:hypothetical protein
LLLEFALVVGARYCSEVVDVFAFGVFDELDVYQVVFKQI